VVLPRSHPATDIVLELGPAPDDTVLTKTSMDTFASTPLAEELHRRGVRTLVLGGVLTDACVESSAQHAAERGFQVSMAEDACAAWEEAFHAASLASLSRDFARIASTRQILPGVGRPRSLSRPPHPTELRAHSTQRRWIEWTTHIAIIQFGL